MSWRFRLRGLLSHQAMHLAVLVFCGTWLLSGLTRLVLAALRWNELATVPGALIAAFGYGAAVDVLMALAAACIALLVTALTHSGRPGARARRAKRGLGLALLGAAIMFVAVAEILFWDEFGTRFNFIAVDYLIYTQEVIGNIRESYPLPALFAALGAAGLLLAWLLARLWPLRAGPAWNKRQRALAVFGATVGMVLAGRAGLALNDAAENASALRGNARNQELARNGPAGFIAALRDNELPFRRFYATVDDAQALRLAGPWPRERAAAPIKVAGQSRSRNVVIIQMESMSADFLGVFGNARGLTPNLDRLARAGISFTEMYAIGTRTVRGLEALSAGVPPLPGQSLVRRPGSSGLLTLGSLLREHGFDTLFLYGGYGYFDNMNAYFAANGYRVRDRRDIADARIGFANVWGIADEYLFDEALDELDRGAAAGGRRLLHLMTTSNHRPYTYPDGRIDIASKTGRDGAVKYADWAIGRFFEQARKRRWFDDTLFVLVADHCASVAGKTRIPPERYRIPAILYQPTRIEPREVGGIASQIDLVPTITALLGIDDGGRFYGQDLLAASKVPRAYLGNYQEIGMLTDAGGGQRDLLVLSPLQRVEQYRIAADGDAQPVAPDPVRRDRAIADYQLADDLLQSGRYRLNPSHPPLRASLPAPRLQ